MAASIYIPTSSVGRFRTCVFKHFNCFEVLCCCQTRGLEEDEDWGQRRQLKVETDAELGSGAACSRTQPFRNGGRGGRREEGQWTDW